MATLTTIRQAVRDQLNEQYGGFFTDTKLDRIINRCYQTIAEDIAKRSNAFIFRHTITTVAGTYLYALTRPLTSTDKIQVLNSSGTMLYQTDPSSVDITVTSSSSTYFGLVGASLALFPVPSTTGETYYAIYSSMPAALTTGATLLLPFGQAAEEYLLYTILEQCKYIEGDVEMLSSTRALKKDARNALMATIDRTEQVYHDTGDFRYEDNE